MVTKTLIFGLVLSLTFTTGSCSLVTLVSDLVSQVVETAFRIVVQIFPPQIATTPKAKIVDEYDFIVVGSGPAGSVVATRLSEVRNWTVLLLEVGESESWITSIPYFAPTMAWTRYNWNYKMEPQPNVCQGMVGKVCPWPRGKALGGTSTINYMIYTRGNKGDFDRLAANGNTGWDSETVLKYYKKAEQCHLDVDLIDADYHSTSGNLHTEHVFKSAVTDAIIEAGNGGQRAADYNGKEQMTFARVQGTVKNGRRNSAAKAYLEPNLGRPNLHILTKALVTKINFDSNNNAVGVDYKYGNKIFTVKARKEVILSAGTFNSPQLLMLSGIGPKEHLESFKIPVRVNAQVGQNMYDHIAYFGATVYLDRKYEEFFRFLNPFVLLEWLIRGDGPLASIGGVTALGYMKTSAATYTENIPDMELILATFGGFFSDNGWLLRKTFGITDKVYHEYFEDNAALGAFLAVPMLLHPKSFGHVELRSTNPEDPVKLYGNHFSHPQDKKAFIAAIRKVIALCEAEPLKSIGARYTNKILPECAHHAKLSDDYIDCTLEYLSTTLHHQVGTCKMGPSTDPNAVVGPDLKVYNVGRLRVIDTSILPEPISAHTNAPSYMIGEKGADMIKQDHGIAI